MYLYLNVHLVLSNYMDRSLAALLMAIPLAIVVSLATPLRGVGVACKTN